LKIAGEFAIIGGAGHVVGASDEVIPVLAIVGAGDRVETSLEAKLVATNESNNFFTIGQYATYLVAV
jgi:hypothetical protein